MKEWYSAQELADLALKSLPCNIRNIRRRAQHEGGECPEVQGNDGGVSNTQRYRMVGNGWTVDVISHIFNFIQGENDEV